VASAKRPRVLLADDYPGIVTATKRSLALDRDVIGVVDDGEKLLDSVTRLQPDVVVVDLNLPKVNGS
jgi:DNA-binding NarL/FixJ family response regulator